MRLRQLQRGQPARFLQPAGVHHRREARRDALAQRLARHLQHEHRAVDARACLAGRAQPVAERAAGGFGHAQRPQHALRVVGGEAGRRLGIQPRQSRMQRRRAEPFGLFGQPRSHRFILGRDLRQSLDERAQVEPRAADDERDAPGRVLGPDGLAGQSRPAGGGEGVRQLAAIQQQVAHARPLLSRRLGGADVQPAIDLHRVAAEDGRPACFGKLQRQRRLADAGRAHQRHGAQGELQASGAGRFSQRRGWQCGARRARTGGWRPSTPG